MRPFADEAGNMRADLDHRHVTGAIMAQYLGISRSTFYRRWIAGEYPREGGRIIGSYTWFQPRIILGIDRPVATR